MSTYPRSSSLADQSLDAGSGHDAVNHKARSQCLTRHVIVAPKVHEAAEMTFSDEQAAHEMRKAAFDQNHAAFRSLNQQMWQIPLISMTLTGGLWFGVSRVEDFPLFQFALLFLAFAGNLILCLVIVRLRFVMEQYLEWLRANYQPGFVPAEGQVWYHKSFVVRRSFQFMLALAACLSLILLIITVYSYWNEEPQIMTDDPAITYYQEHATRLADGYEAVTLEDAHPALLALLASEFADRPLEVLDVGAGTGRDAAWFAARDHRVVAVEPSYAMRKIAQRLHANSEIDWRNESLPDLTSIAASNQRFDLINLSAVWMHVPPEQRQRALQTLKGLLKPQGLIYLTLRLGPAEPARGIHPVSEDEVQQLASSIGMRAGRLDEQIDLLGRSSIRWVSMQLKEN